MTEKAIRILSTRPLAQTILQQAAEEAISIDQISFIETENCYSQNDAKEILGFANMEIATIFTSMNAAEAVIDLLDARGSQPTWIIYTLAGITGKIVKDYFVESEIFSTARNSTQLAEEIVRNDEKQVIFFCGDQRRDELPDMLSAHEIEMKEIVVYRTIEKPVKVETNYDGVLFFSPSAVKSFFSINKTEATTVLFAIGKTTAEELTLHSSNKILIGTHPNKELLANQAMQYLKSKLSA